MGKAPAVVIIVRHGARLDAADKSWHLSSPTPYDPPLTYGGWVQSRALGLRIASLLNARDNENSTSAVQLPNVLEAGHSTRDFAQAESTSNSQANGKGKQKKRKHKVIIHSSPFQRCVQTSVGISAGLAQFDGIVAARGRKDSDTRSKTISQMHSASPRIRAADVRSSPRLQPVPEPSKSRSGHRDTVRCSLQDHKPSDKATLRVDAFLGEWLSPSYFELITPPPNSTLMVASAKANLLRKSDIEVFTPITPKLTGNLWGAQEKPSRTQSVTFADTDAAKDATRSTTRVIPRRDRTYSQGSNASTSSRGSDGRSSPLRTSHTNSPSKPEATFGYTPPQPTYAVSPLDPIPRGYVAHARDACTDVDYHWDSMRPPHLWGDGGEYGEEWSAMHKRFRKGLNSMLQWYSENEVVDDLEAVPTAMLNEEEGEEADDDIDLALVIVTHGAGCNALIGGLTNQPVLIDVGMASLTMAVRKNGADFPRESLHADSPAASPAPTPDAPDGLERPQPVQRKSSVDLGLSNVYDMKIVASSEHLRPGVDPSKSSMLAPSSPMLASQTVPEYRRRYGSGSHAAAGAPIASTWDLGEPARPNHPALGSMRRSSQATVMPIRSGSIASQGRASPPTGTAAAGGLWAPLPERLDSPVQRESIQSPLATSTTTLASEEGKCNVSPKNIDGASTPVNAHEAAEAENEVKDLPSVSANVPTSLGRSLSQKGLWGSAPSGARNERQTGVPKRRWTLVPEAA